MKRGSLIFCVMVSFILLVFFVIMEKNATAAATGPIKIGVVTAKSSFLAYHGEDAENGYMMAAEEINEKGGVLGRPIQFVWKATKIKPDVAAREARFLVFEEALVLML